MTAFDMASVQPLQEDASAQTALDVYVGFSSSNVNQVITKKTLDDLMRQYGAVLHILVKKHQVEMHLPFQSGYAFVAYADLTGALLAAKALHNQVLNGITFSCQLAKRSLDRINKETFTEAYTKVNELMSSLHQSSSSNTLESAQSTGYNADMDTTIMQQQHGMLPQACPPPPPPQGHSPATSHSSTGESVHSVVMVGSGGYPPYPMQHQQQVQQQPLQQPLYFNQGQFLQQVQMQPVSHYVQMPSYQYQQGYMNLNMQMSPPPPSMQPSQQYIFANYATPYPPAPQQYYNPNVSPTQSPYMQPYIIMPVNYPAAPQHYGYATHTQGETNFASPRRRPPPV